MAPALYLADSEATVWSEWYRGLAEASVPPRRWLPRDLWELEVDVDVADLATASSLRAHGIDRPRPDRSSWSSFQGVGEGLAAAGWAGLVAPSAARPTGLVLCLFWRGAHVDGVRPIPPPRRVDEAPAPPRGMTT